MIGLRPILSDSQPKRTKNGVPIASATAMTMFDVVPSSFRVWVRKNRA